MFQSAAGSREPDSSLHCYNSKSIYTLHFYCNQPNITIFFTSFIQTILQLTPPKIQVRTLPQNLCSLRVFTAKPRLLALSVFSYKFKGHPPVFHAVRHNAQPYHCNDYPGVKTQAVFFFVNFLLTEDVLASHIALHPPDIQKQSSVPVCHNLRIAWLRALNGGPLRLL